MMKKMKKSILAIVLALAVVLTGTLPGGFALQTVKAEEVTTINEDQIISNGIESAASFLNSQGYTYECGASYGASDWYIMSKLRTGQEISDTNKDNYYKSAVETVAKWTEKQSVSDIARVALTLSAMGKDITDVGGVNLAAMIYNHPELNSNASYLLWGILALDASEQKIPEDAKWNREGMIDALLQFQNTSSDESKNGGFCWVGTDWVDVDMTGMSIQALAPYVGQEKVKEAVDRGLAFMKRNMTADYGYSTAESAAQVILALASLKLDPIEAGFASENASVLSKLQEDYAVTTGGYAHDKTGKVNAMATYQTMEALEAYRRYKASEEGYWNMQHQKVEIIAGKEATCTESGLTEGKKCTNCGSILEKQKEIPAKGHKYGKWTTSIAPTVDKKGEQIRKCSECGHIEKRELAKLSGITTAINVNSKKVTVYEKKGFQLKVKLTPSYSKEGITYTSSNKKVATVSKKGYIKGVKAGTATITVKSGKKSAKVKVTVKKVTTKKLTANKKSIKLAKNKTFAWKVKKAPTNSSEKITYSSSNKKVATVSKNGKITAKKSGKAVIIAKSGKKKVTIKVTVK